MGQDLEGKKKVQILAIGQRRRNKGEKGKDHPLQISLLRPTIDLCCVKIVTSLPYDATMVSNAELAATAHSCEPIGTCQPLEYFGGPDMDGHRSRLTHQIPPPLPRPVTQGSCPSLERDVCRLHLMDNGNEGSEKSLFC